MEAAADAIRRRVAGADPRLSGEVRLTTTEALGSRIIAPGLAALGARHPELTVALLPEPRSLSLARREADLAIRLLRPRERATVGRRAGRVSYAAYAARGRPASPTRRERLLVYAPPIAGEETAALERRFPGAAVAVRSPSTLALAAAAGAGAGVAVLPCFVGDAEPALERVAGPEGFPTSEVWLVVHRDLRKSARTAAVAEHVAELLARAAPALAGR
jgi:DNA-binding transcriptional LysR family regulator